MWRIIILLILYLHNRLEKNRKNIKKNKKNKERLENDLNHIIILEELRCLTWDQIKIGILWGGNKID